MIRCKYKSLTPCINLSCLIYTYIYIIRGVTSENFLINVKKITTIGLHNYS